MTGQKNQSGHDTTRHGKGLGKDQVRHQEEKRDTQTLVQAFAAGFGPCCIVCLCRYSGRVSP
jgi:hypothetical protein